jgi:hypothetical protein
MERTTKQKIYRVLLILLAILTLALVILFLFRGTILEKAVIKVENKFKEDYNCNLFIKEADFDGLSGVAITEISMVPYNADTLLSVQKIKTKVNLFQLITGDIQIDNLEMENGFIQLVKNENGRNFDAFLKSKSKEIKTDEKRDYAELAYKLITKALNLVPENIDLTNVSIKLNDMGKKALLKTHKLQLKNHQLETTVFVQTDTFEQNWIIKGLADPRAKKGDITISNVDGSQLKLPYVDEKYKLLTSFDNLHFKVDKIDFSFGKLNFDGYASVENLTVNNPKIASKDVVIKNSSINYKLLFGSNFIALDSTSVVELNSIKMNPYVEYNTEKDTIYKLQAKINQTKAQDFINSLPDGLFSHFQGMQAEGAFDYKLNFKFNKNKPYQLVFESKLNKQNVKILKYGEANLSKLNEGFTYRAFDNGKFQRPIQVSLSNPNYTPMGQISAYLEKSVLTCEDPSFMRHKGFINEAFKQSIIKNIKTKKFSRGASTISMQLVKNVFLTREKTLSRKLEEILLVYILENNRIASKQRMLEVYFNIIEWGPNVYGIGEAAAFYFQKKPIDLTLKECLFLASIVPKPKKFMYQFDNEGKLNHSANNKTEYISRIMMRRGLISAFDTIGHKTPLYITGRARTHLNLKVMDTIPIDLKQEEKKEFNF